MAASPKTMKAVLAKPMPERHGEELAALVAAHRRTNKPHVPDDISRRFVANWAEIGASPVLIAAELGIDDDTLRKHYAYELKGGEARGVANVAAALYERAMRGDVAAQIFYLKVKGPRVGWSDRQTEDKPSTVVQLDIVQAITSTIAALRQGTMPAARTIDATTATQSPPALPDGRDLL